MINVFLTIRNFIKHVKNIKERFKEAFSEDGFERGPNALIDWGNVNNLDDVRRNIIGIMVSAMKASSIVINECFGFLWDQINIFLITKISTFVVNTLINWVQRKLVDKLKKAIKNKVKKMALKFAARAALGAALGSVVPGIGNVVGFLLGAAIAAVELMIERYYRFV